MQKHCQEKLPIYIWVQKRDCPLLTKVCLYTLLGRSIAPLFDGHPKLSDELEKLWMNDLKVCSCELQSGIPLRKRLFLKFFPIRNWSKLSLGYYLEHDQSLLMTVYFSSCMWKFQFLSCFKAKILFWKYQGLEVARLIVWI